MRTIIYPSLRRRFLYYFRPEYVKSSIAKRTGNCTGCSGVCCKRTRACPFLRLGKCRIYRKMPLFCKIFPVDKKDIEISGVSDVCRYRWD
jgi:hypothetical protein